MPRIIISLSNHNVSWCLHHCSSKSGASSKLLAYDVSADMCSPLFELRESINQVLDELASMLLDQFWPLFTEELDKYLCECILQGRAKYTQNGAEQLRHNMKVLFSFIQPYYQPTGTIFSGTKDCIRILTLEGTDVRQLHRDLYMLNASEQKRVLGEYRITVLTGREAETLLKKRSDVTIA